MADQEVLLLLVLGLVVVAVDGQVLYHSGKRYLAGTDDGGESVASMTKLIVVLFHLVAVGLLALVAMIDIGGSGAQAVISRIGIMLLIVALIHAAALGILTRMRDARRSESTSVSARAERERQVLYDPVVAPVSGQHGPSPEVSPGIESGGPYSASL